MLAYATQRLIGTRSTDLMLFIALLSTTRHEERIEVICGIIGESPQELVNSFYISSSLQYRLRQLEFNDESRRRANVKQTCKGHASSK